MNFLRPKTNYAEGEIRTGSPPEKSQSVDIYLAERSKTLKPY